MFEKSLDVCRQNADDTGIYAVTGVCQAKMLYVLGSIFLESILVGLSNVKYFKIIIPRFKQKSVANSCLLVVI